MTAPDPVGVEQPFVAHLIELRNRLLRMVVAVLLLVVVLMGFANDIYTWLAAPLLSKLPEGASMIATQVASPFLAPFKLSALAALLLAMPYILYQIWSFVAPGLYAHEKRVALPLLVASVTLFYLGMAFAYYAVFPLVFGFFTTTAPVGVKVMTDISAYLDFTLMMFLAFGVAFQVPVATILLVLIGLVSADKLAEQRPYVTVGVFIIAMILTPPDVLSQLLMAIPMLALFEIGLLFARLLERAKRERVAREEPVPAEPEHDPESRLNRYEADQAAVEGRHQPGEKER